MDTVFREWRSKAIARSLFFLGAGASKAFGYPITRDLMFPIFQGLATRKVLALRMLLDGF